MNRTLSLIVWTVTAYYTSLNMEQFGFGDLTQIVGLVIGTALAAFFITAFVAKERELLKLGMLFSFTCLALAGLQDSHSYFNFYYDVDKYILINKSLALILIGTAGAIRCIHLYEVSLKLKEQAQSLLQIFRGLFAEETEEA